MPFYYHAAPATTVKVSEAYNLFARPIVRDLKQNLEKKYRLNNIYESKTYFYV